MFKYLYNLALAAAVISLFIFSTASPASAAACKLYNGSTSTKASSGNWYTQSFTTPTGGCNDTNLYLTSFSNYYKGQYHNGSYWQDGAPGWKYVPANQPAFNAGRVLISGVLDGTHVRAVEFQHGPSAVTLGL